MPLSWYQGDKLDIETKNKRAKKEPKGKKGAQKNERPNYCIVDHEV